jgi:hypothetical protein
VEAHDVHDLGEIVGEHTQCHLAGDARKRLHRKVGRSHARLDRAEGVLNRLTPLSHLLGMFVEPALHGFENMPRLIRRIAVVVQWLLSAQVRQALVQ